MTSFVHKKVDLTIQTDGNGLCSKFADLLCIQVDLESQGHAFKLETKYKHSQNKYTIDAKKSFFFLSFFLSGLNSFTELFMHGVIKKQLNIN